MSKKTNPVMAVFAVGLFIFSIVFYYARTGTLLGSGEPESKSQSTSSPDATSPAVTVDANTLVQAYDDNEVAADATYKGKRLTVSGSVGQVGVDILGKKFITIKSTNSQFKWVQCYFQKSAEGGLLPLKRGSKVTVTGTCSGLVLNVLLEDCVFRQ